ncbi:MAG: hypothetical protein GC204_00525 [Chloroflexi bacterium]|nr:hypothetical protein [Chloroflexota bacterium]
MFTRFNRYFGRAVFLLMLLLLTSCADIFALLHGGVDLAPFQQNARDGACADIRNHLFLIDNQWVFWDIAGNCADASYAQILYGSSPEQVLCNAHDSIAGPMKHCADPQYFDLFNTITAHLDQPDLGLGADHTVEPIPF